jgi:hypothetical protein
MVSKMEIVTSPMTNTSRVPMLRLTRTLSITT